MINILPEENEEVSTEELIKIFYKDYFFKRLRLLHKDVIYTNQIFHSKITKCFFSPVS